jgi:hypothetical protein
METAILTAAVLAGAAACPLVAIVQRRRGRVSCCAPERSSARAPGESLTELRAHRAHVEERITLVEGRSQMRRVPASR